MTTVKKGEIGENIVINILEKLGVAYRKTDRSGATFGDGDLIMYNGVPSDDAVSISIDVKNESKVNKTLLKKLHKIEKQAGKLFNCGAIVDFDENMQAYMHIKLESLIEFIKQNI